MGNWYRQNGERVEDADLRLARKENLWPSVTTILDILEKPGLTAWKLKVGPEVAEERSLKTREEGKRLHDRVADWIDAMRRGIDYAPEDGLADRDLAVLEPLFQYLNANIDWDHDVMSEETFVKRAGFAGTLDIFARMRDGNLTILDLKTKDIKPGRKATPFFENAIQLGAYQRMLDHGHIAWQSIMINRDPEYPTCDVHHWPGRDQQRATKAFSGLLKAWQAMKDYVPVWQDE